MKVLVAITGASGFPLAVKTLKELGKKEIERHLIVSKNAHKVREQETELTSEQIEQLCEHYYKPDAIHTSICSGSYPINAMIIVPCSMNTLAKIAGGIEDNAITRAAGVNIKQERKVILVPRETPLHLAALKNMVKAKQQGCSIVPPMLAHHTKPKTIENSENFVIGKILELLGIEHTLYQEWNVKK
ncbi:UbiX family flavin prenyltransferase [archaeon]|nr:UbiX family flavin prenyltransferase [archaeon]